MMSDLIFTAPVPRPDPSMRDDQHIYDLGRLNYGHLIVLRWALTALMRVKPNESECATFRDAQSGIYDENRLDLHRRLNEIAEWHEANIADPD